MPNLLRFYRLVTLVLTILPVIIVSGNYTYPWQNPTLPVNQRVANLISLLNVTEKIMLLNAEPPAIPRLSLPSYSFAEECERGDTSGPTGTSFPSGIALGSTFNSSLVYEVAHYTAIEARANSDIAGRGASCFGPVINFISMPLWGRTNEMIGGEDTTLATIMGSAFTQGIQTGTAEGTGTNYRMINTIAKHLSSYSGPEGYCGGVTFATQSRFSNTATMDARTWWEFFIPPWRALAVEANVTGFMSSYQAVNLVNDEKDIIPGYQYSGIPDTANSYLLTEILRNQWNWSGYILSDAGAVAFVGTVDWQGTNIGHGYASNASDAAVKALTAGVDLELVCCALPPVYGTLQDSIANGIISETLLDISLNRTLPYRFELGKLDPPGYCPYDNFTSANVSTPAMVESALAAAKQAIVLLKNDQGVLPLNRDILTGKTVTIFGPSGNDTLAQQGGYVNQHPYFIRTPLEGFTDALPLSNVVYASGCDDGIPCLAPNPNEALDLVNSSDVIIMFLGTTVYNPPNYPCSPDNVAVEAEGWDRANASLPLGQLALLQSVAAVASMNQIPLILVVVNAGMLDISWAEGSTEVSAIVHAPFLGMTSGIAIASVILGETNPAGRLTHTWYTADGLSSIGTLTDYRMRPDPSTNFPGRTYRYTTAPVQYPFGYGLSYSRFGYSNVIVNPTYNSCDIVTVVVTVTNLSPIDGSEVVQLYVTMPNSTVPSPIRGLANFTRVFIPAGQSTAVTLSIKPRTGSSVLRNTDYVPVIEPGYRNLWIGGCSDPTILPGSFASYQVVGNTVPVTVCEST